MPPVAQPVPRFLEYTQIQTSFLETHGTTSHDKFCPCSKEKHVMLENENLAKQASQSVPQYVSFYIIDMNTLYQ